ncbi:FtsK/SpoIIIE domain-containing protein [Staphylococcus shinii]|uniref:FtsK/SpoIIIE domain-containing protein n=1 Tax=Staphylococcus shinii TaxID=2912228 RepID=UPI003F566A29
MSIRTPLQKASSTFVLLGKIIVGLILLNVIFAKLIKPILIKMTHIIFDNDFLYTIYSEIYNSLAETSVDLSNAIFKFIPEVHTSSWGNNLENNTQFIGMKSIIVLLSILTGLIIAYFVTLLLRSHKGEIKPTKNDKERKKLKKGIRNATNSQRKDYRDIYKAFEKTDKELNPYKKVFKRKKTRIYKYGSPELIAKLIYVETFKKADVSVMTMHEEGNPQPEKNIAVIIGNPSNINASTKVFSTVKEFHNTLIKLTKITFDQYVQPKERGEYTFKGSVEVEYKDTRLVKVDSKNSSKDKQETRNSYSSEQDFASVEGNYPLELLDDRTQDVEKNTQKAQSLADDMLVKLDEYFSSSNIQADMVKCTIGKSIISYDYRVRKGKIPKDKSNLVADLKFYLDIPSISVMGVGATLIIGFPIPKKDMIAIDNRKVIAESTAKSKNPLDAVLGIKQSGETMLADIAKAPHFLISGATGSGKSVGLNYILLSISHHATPDEFELALLDPKRVEFKPFTGHPCNIVDPVKEPEDCVTFLKYAVITMEERYRELEKYNCRNIDSYNKKMRKKNEPIMKHMLIVIDELADLMMSAKDTEKLLARLAQKARACGMHVLVATQRPSVDVITGTIKNNFLTRLTYKLQGSADSRTALGSPGAESLNGAGDSLLLGYDYGNNDGDFLRMQGGYIEEHEVDGIIDHLKNNFKANEKIDFKKIVTIDEGEFKEGEENPQVEAVTSFAQTRQEFADEDKALDKSEQLKVDLEEDDTETQKERKTKTFSQSASAFNIDPRKTKRNKSSRTRKYGKKNTSDNDNTSDIPSENESETDKTNTRKLESEMNEVDKSAIDKANSRIKENQTYDKQGENAESNSQINTKKTDSEMGELDRLILNKAVEKVKERQKKKAENKAVR